MTSAGDHERKGSVAPGAGRSGPALAGRDGLPPADEAGFGAIVHQAMVGIAQTDVRGNLLFVNRRFCELVGYDGPELLTKNILELVHPEDAPMSRAQREEVARSGTSALLEKRYVHASGRHVWVTSNISAIRDEAGEPSALVAVITDISDIKRRELSQELLAEAGNVLAESLDYERTVRAIAELAVPRLADICTLYIQGDDGQLERLAIYCDASLAETAEGVQLGNWHVRPDGEGTIAEALGRGETVAVLEVDEDWLRAHAPADEERERRSALQPRSVLLVPLRARGQVLGVMGLLRTGAVAPYDEHDGHVAEELARTAALAADNARLYDESLRSLAEREDAIARHRLMETHLTLLIEASGALISSLELEDMLPTIMRLSRRLISADAYAIWNERVPNRWEMLSWDGLSDEYVTTPATAVATADPPPAIETMVIPDVMTDERLANRTDGYAREGIRSLLVLPLSIQGRATGTLTFYYRTPHEFTDEEVRVGTALANLAASAISSSRLYHDQRETSGRLEEANRRLRFLAEASAILSSSLDYRTTLDNIAKLAVPEIADWCGIDMLTEDGGRERLAVAHVVEDRVALAREVGRRYPETARGGFGYQRVVRTGEPVLIHEFTDEMLREVAVNDEHLAMLRELGLGSSIVVPVVARGEVLGAITVLHTSSARRYDEDDVAFMQEVARRAGGAIDNARLYEGQQRIASDLAKANAAKDEFLGLVSHELKTPITTILGNADVLIRRAGALDDESREEALADIRQDAQRLHRIIDNLLVLARLERGQEIELESLLLQRVADRLVSEHQRQHPLRPIAIAADERLPAAIAQPEYIDQVMRNLLSNAEKYSLDLTSPIEVELWREGGEIVACVRDRGAGISSDEAEQIFEAFYRSSRNDQRVQGMGIGLAVCKRLMEAQDGRIWARPREGGGSEFGFALPVDPEAG